MQQKKPSGLKSKISISSALNPIEISKFKKPRWSGVIDNLLESGRLGALRRDIKRIGITVDSQIQLILDDVLKQVSFEESIHQVAAVVLDNKTCDVLGESSWSNGKELNFSPTFQGRIQPGSTFKTFAFLAALENGLTSDLKLSSSPFISEFIRNDDGKLWTVRNYNDTYRGDISLSHALECSDNTVYARLAELLDLKDLLNILTKYHLCSGELITPSIVLGASTRGISLLDLVAAYAAIARNGKYIKPRFIKYVEDCRGQLNWSHTGTPGDIICDNYWAINQVKKVLQDAGELAGFAGFSGKTGTTKKGSIFVGYNEKISVAIWTGFKETPEEGDPKAITSQRTFSKIIETALGYRSKLFSI
jgi:penicillin-binding protein 1A